MNRTIIARICCAFLILTAVTVFATSMDKKVRTMTIYFSKGGICTTVDVASAHFTTGGGVVQADIVDDTGTSYPLYNDNSCSTPLYFNP